MLGLNVVAADSDEEAKFLFTSLQQAFVNLRAGNPGQLPPPVNDVSPYFADPRIAAMLKSVLSLAQVGSPATVKAGIEAFIAEHKPDELMVTGQIFDHAKRLRSYEILSQL
jgi:alkanesulfonate monooxygenase SsuD/methylene tetrahydromethanopterin reductase-like flavin-dependent oxidoreductase (luciferase family)